MPTDHIVALLIAERDKLDAAIKALQDGAGPGRPATSAVVGNGPRKKRTFTAAQRRKQGERMKAYWAAKKRAAKK